MQDTVCFPGQRQHQCEPFVDCQLAHDHSSFALECEECVLEHEVGSSSTLSTSSHVAASPNTSSAGCSPRWACLQPPTAAGSDNKDYLEHLLLQEHSTLLSGFPLSDHLADCQRVHQAGQIADVREYAVHRHHLVNSMTQLAFHQGCSSDTLFLAVACLDRCACSHRCLATQSVSLGDGFTTSSSSASDSSGKLLPPPPPNAHPLLQQYHHAATLQLLQQQAAAQPLQQQQLPVGACGCLAGALLHRRWSWLLATACLWVAAKYEDNIATTAGSWLAATGAPFAPQQLLAAEAAVLKQLDYRLAAIPTAKTFLRRIMALHASATPLDPQLYHLASYLVEVSLLEYQLLDQPASMVAAAAYRTARQLLQGATPLPHGLGGAAHLGYHAHQLTAAEQYLLALFVHLAEAARCGNAYAATLKYLSPDTYPSGTMPLPLRVPLPCLAVVQGAAPAATLPPGTTLPAAPTGLPGHGA